MILGKLRLIEKSPNPIRFRFVFASYKRGIWLNKAIRFRFVFATYKHGIWLKKKKKSLILYKIDQNSADLSTDLAFKDYELSIIRNSRIPSRRKTNAQISSANEGEMSFETLILVECKQATPCLFSFCHFHFSERILCEKV